MPLTILVSAFSNFNHCSNGRTIAVYKYIQGDNIVLTADFNHGEKRYYTEEETLQSNQIALHVPAYHKNLGVKRIWSHLVFAKEVKEFLSSLDEKPDAIYCAMPTSLSAYVCAKFCKKYGVKFIIDIIDLWPDSLLPLIKGKAVIKALLYPWTYLTRYAYKNADVIMGESVAYAYEAKKFNKKAEVYPLYLGVEMGVVNQVKAKNPVSLVKPDDEIWIAYAGSLGTSYDFETLLNAVRGIHGRYKYKLWFVGDGVKYNEIDTFIKDNGQNAEITGYLPYEQLLGYLAYCDIAVNIFRKNTKVVYSYKFNDYVAMDCVVLNSLDGETAQMVDEYQIGRNFNFDDKPLSAILEDTLAHWDKYSLWKDNCQKLVEDRLDKGKIYKVVKEIFKV